MAINSFYNSLPPLDAHQVAGINWILSRPKSYLTHAPGAGKTAQALLSFKLLHMKNPIDQGLFIVPPSLTKNWEREILKWTPELSYSICPLSHQKLTMKWFSKIIIIPDSLLSKDWVQSQLTGMKFVFVAVDEASRFKESTSERAVALFGGENKKKKRFPGLCYKSKHVVLLDGSPMPNRSMELWAPTYALSPESIDHMDQNAFGFRYCGATINDYGKWEFKGDSHQEELKSKLTQSFMHVVSEKELSHPERIRSILYMSKEIRSQKEIKWEKEALKKLDFEKLSDENAYSNGELAAYRRCLGLKKVQWTRAFIEEKLKENLNERIILFAWHRDVCFELEEQLSRFRPGLVMGGTPDKIREHHFTRFKRGQNRLLIMNIQAGGRGHNLQEATRIVFAEYSWCDETNKQAEKRASRKGNDELSIRCQYIVAPDSMDELVLKAVFRKEQNVKRVIGV